MKRKTLAATVAGMIVMAVGLNSLLSENNFGGPVYETSQTQEIVYTVASYQTSSYSEALHLAGRKLRKHVGAGFIVTPKGQEPSKVRDLSLTKEAIKRLLSKQSTSFTVLALQDDYILKVSKFDMDPKAVLSTIGTPEVDIIVGSVVKEFPNVGNLGIYNCRHIAGSSSWSQHAWAHAVDFGGPTELLNKVANYLYKLTKEHGLPASQILWRGRNMLTGNSVSGHYDHIHVTGLPPKVGIPPCA